MGLQHAPAKSGTTTRATAFRAAPARRPAHRPIHSRDQSVGSNQALQRLLEHNQIQRKLTVNERGDRFEQEADRVADRVMRMPAPASASRPPPSRLVPEIQRACAACEEELQRQAVEENEEEEEIQRATLTKPPPVQRLCASCQAARRGRHEVDESLSLVGSHPPTIQRMCAECAAEFAEDAPAGTALPWATCQPPAIQRLCEECEEELQRRSRPDGTAERNAIDGRPVDWSTESEIRSLRDGGMPLPDSVRNFFEPRFEHDFSQVRIHTDQRADSLARSLSARAFTTGSHIAFGAGQYEPQSSAGRRLIAHELTHTIQQTNGGKVAPRPARASPARNGSSPTARAALAPMMPDRIPAASDSALAPEVQRFELPTLDDIASGAEDAFDSAVATGEAVVGAVGEAGEAVVEAGEQLAGIAVGLWNQARALAGALGSVVTLSGGKLIINVPPMSVCPTIPLQFTLPEIGTLIPFGGGVIPVTGIVNLYGEVGLQVSITPEIYAQLGPCQLHGLRIVIDPLGPSFSAAGSITITVAAGIGGEAHVALRGEVGILILWPDPPIILQIPVAGIEAGLAGFGRGIIANTMTFSGAMSYGGGRFSLAASRSDDIGLALDLGLAGYGSVDVLGQNLCTLYWPFLEWHGDSTISTSMSLALTVDSSGASAVLDLPAPRINPFPFDSLPVEVERGMFNDDCPLCDFLYRAGLMPSQLHGPWPFHPTPAWPGPLDVYPRDPYSGGALCRGACGPDCWFCQNLGDVYECEEVGDRHVFWRYSNYEECPTHRACRDHDGCYDWCTGMGFSIIGPCHRLCDFQCICDYGVPSCAGWIFGQGGDGLMYFSDPPVPIGGCRGPCPTEEEGPEGVIQRLCLPDIPLFDQRRFAKGWTRSLGSRTLYSRVVNVPYIGPVVLSVFVKGSAAATIGAGIGPAFLTNLCLIVDPTIPSYKGTAELHVQASIDGLLRLTGKLGGRADWLCLFEVIRAEGTLEATGTAKLETDLITAAEVSCRDGDITLEADISLDACLKLAFLLDALFELFLFKFKVFSDRWPLLKKQWEKCWNIPIKVLKGTVPGGPGLLPNISPELVAGLVDFMEILSFIMRKSDAKHLDKVLPKDPAKKAKKENPCGDVDPEDECGSDQLPITVVSFTGSTRGESMTANPLTKCRGNTTGAGPPRTRLPGFACIRNAPQPPIETDFWVHAHLLHGKTGSRDLHGPDEPRNLIITDKSINGLMSTRVEQNAISRIHNNDEVLSYSATARHAGTTADRRFFADGMQMDVDRIDPVTGTVLESIFHGMIVSNTQRPIPANCV